LPSRFDFVPSHSAVQLLNFQHFNRSSWFNYKTT